MNDYAHFLATKRVEVEPAGFQVEASDLNPMLFAFQQMIVLWALRLGRAALFLGVGLGKTFIQLEWARFVAAHTHRPVLILAPLAVGPQTVREGQKFGIQVYQVRDIDEFLAIAAGSFEPRIFITNYDRVDHFDLTLFGGIVLDESSILKHYTKTFFALTERCKDIPFRLCCTATPAPNDFVEFGNHATFLGIMDFHDMLARWFVGEGDIARRARLKGHARADFWRWLTSWSVCISKPSDLGDAYHMDGYDLPLMHVYEHRLGASEGAITRAWKEGKLLPDTAPSATGFMRVKRESLNERVSAAQDIVGTIDPTEPLILWCDTDFEADALLAVFGGDDVVEVRGSQTPKQKEDGLTAFSEGRKRIIITKPEIAGFGLNWQHCAHMIFAGSSFSFERPYQAVGRIYRFGQTRDVHIHWIYAETEGSVMQLFKEKQAAFAEMQQEMNAAMREHGLFREGSVATVFSKAGFDKAEGARWTYFLGDCVQVMGEMEAGSVDLTVTSIPFSNLYTYSDSEADVGNAADKAEFFGHMEFVITELLRITTPGRCCAVHVKDLPLFLNRDGVMGIDPFSDDVTAAFRRAGWVLQSRVTIEKDPVIEMQKTNSHGLLFKNWKERGEILRVGLPDYVLVFVKPGDCPNPVKHDPTDLTYYGDNPPAAYRWLTLPSRKTGEMNTALPVWQEYANPNWSDVTVPLVWTDVDQTDVLNYLIAKDNADERHLCPLQLDLIARCIQWKSNVGDVVFDPFGGVASTGYKALEMGRKFVGAELKDSYHRLGVKYLKEAELKAAQVDMFTWAAQQKQEAQP